MGSVDHQGQHIPTFLSEMGWGWGDKCEFYVTFSLHFCSILVGPHLFFFFFFFAFAIIIIQFCSTFVLVVIFSCFPTLFLAVSCLIFFQFMFKVGYSTEFSVGVCCLVLQTLTLFNPKYVIFQYPFSNLSFEIHTHCHTWSVRSTPIFRLSVQNC